MKVLGAGFSKTGTKTIDRALEILGYKVSGFGRTTSDLQDDWLYYIEGKGTIEDLKRMYEGYDATSGSPTFHYWEDFLKAYPDIKIILMIREEDSWIRSLKSELDAQNSSPVSFPLAYFSWSARKHFRLGQKFARRFMNISTKRFNKYYEGVSDEKFIEKFRKHNENVIKGTPPNQLLIYNVKEGWKPLCKFLNKDIPDETFPHVNKGNVLFSELLKNNSYYANMYTEMYITISVMVAGFAIVLILCSGFVFN